MRFFIGTPFDVVGFPRSQTGFPDAEDELVFGNLPSVTGLVGRRPQLRPSNKRLLLAFAQFPKRPFSYVKKVHRPSFLGEKGGFTSNTGTDPAIKKCERDTPVAMRQHFFKKVAHALLRATVFAALLVRRIACFVMRLIRILNTYMRQLGFDKFHGIRFKLRMVQIHGVREIKTLTAILVGHGISPCRFGITAFKVPWRDISRQVNSYPQACMAFVIKTARKFLAVEYL